MTRTTFSASIAALAFAGLIIVARSWRTNERIERIDVRGAQLMSVDEVTAQAQIAPRMSFGAVDLAAVRARLMQHPLIRKAAVSRDRNEVVIAISERTPVARVMVNGAMRLVDADGVLLPERRVNVVLDLPLLCGIASPLNDRLDSVAIVEALEVLKAAGGSAGIGGMISTIRRDHDGSYWIETTGDAVPVHLGGADHSEEKFALLQEFLPRLERSRMDRGRAQYVDLRFRDQVVVRWQDAASVQPH